MKLRWHILKTGVWQLVVPLNLRIQYGYRSYSFSTVDKRITVTRPIVDLDGDEMSRLMWEHIKEQLIRPYLKLECLYFDLSLTNRILTDDQITLDASRAIGKYNVGIKCPGITADKSRSTEFNLKRVTPSPNAKIRNYFGGTVFHEPVLCKNIPPLIPGWKKQIIVGRHAYGDQYNAVDIVIPRPGLVELLYTPDDGSGPRKIKVCQIKQNHSSSQYSKGVTMAMFNTDESIQNFANRCFQYSLQKKMSLYFSTKNTVLGKYDGRFIEIFRRTYDREYRRKFSGAGITYEHFLIDNMVALVLKSNGGFVWACKNYDGDVQSDIVAQGYGSSGLMTTILISPDGKTVITEAGHGTVTRHFRQYQKGEKPLTNPIASIYSWTRGLHHRADLDDNLELKRFVTQLEKACVTCVEKGLMTKDLAVCIHGKGRVRKALYLTTAEFLEAVRQQLVSQLQNNNNSSPN